MDRKRIYKQGLMIRKEQVAVLQIAAVNVH